MILRLIVYVLALMYVYIEFIYLLLVRGCLYVLIGSLIVCKYVLIFISKAIDLLNVMKDVYQTIVSFFSVYPVILIIRVLLFLVFIYIFIFHPKKIYNTCMKVRAIIEGRYIK